MRLHNQLWQVPRRRRRTGLCLAGLAASKKRAELLVDADQRGLHPTMEAIDKLQKKGFNVETTIFAAPGRVDSKAWQSCFQQPGVSFSPVPRNEGGEASDKAITAKLMALAQSRGVACIALLTTDGGFSEQVRHIVSLRNHDICIFTRQVQLLVFGCTKKLVPASCLWLQRPLKLQSVVVRARRLELFCSRTEVEL